MSSQPFDDYKNKGVEYDYVIQANVNIETFADESYNELLNLLTNEDLLGIYFTQIALGRVYSKCEYLNNKLYFTFGISLVDAPEKVTSKDLIADIKEFILSLNKNITQTPKLKIKESDIKVDILSENKEILDNIDKKLVNESNLIFKNGNNVQSLVLTSDGVVERYNNGTLSSTIPFSKLGVIRECKSIVADGYSLTLKTEATIQNQENNDILDNPEKTKQDLQQDIKDIDEIQDLKDELEDKLATLTETTVNDEKYVLILYTDIYENGNFSPDVAMTGTSNGYGGYSVADSIAAAPRYNKETADSIVQEFNSAYKGDDPKFILKAINEKDLDSIEGLEESKLYEQYLIDLTQTNSTFPSSDFTSKLKTADELNSIELDTDLSVEQLAWLQNNIGNINEIETGLKNLANDIINIAEPIISLDDYFNKLNLMLKGE